MNAIALCILKHFELWAIDLGGLPQIPMRFYNRQFSHIKCQRWSMPNKLFGLRPSEIAEMVLTGLIFKIYLRYIELILLFVYRFDCYVSKKWE